MALRKRRSVGPCCWVTGGSRSEPMCSAHEKAVGEAVVRDSRAVMTPATVLYRQSSDMSYIDLDDADSATPGLDQEPGADL